MTPVPTSPPEPLPEPEITDPDPEQPEVPDPDRLAEPDAPETHPGKE
ncbi:MAG: hypothetical protein ACHQ4F_16580 [Candidatus Dormibacteria bacterium]